MATRWNDLKSVPTPCYVVDEAALTRNLQTLKTVADAAGCKVLLAQKAFSMYVLYPLIGQYLAGTAASGLHEARLGREEMGGETHVFSPAYTDATFDEIVALCDHIVFNSFTQWQRFQKRALASDKTFGMRINPECSTQAQAIYDPCAAGSRLGVTRAQFRTDLLGGLTGLHFHTLCEQNSDALVDTLKAVEANFGDLLPRMDWVNFGGGHLITKDGYDIPRLVDAVRAFRAKYGVEVYLEPGEAVAYRAGWLVASVADIVENGIKTAVLDASAACHMPDVLEMPYRPPLLDSAPVGEKPFSYRLAGPTCLAGDVIGDYSFDAPLRSGDRLVFEDMAIYTMVKNNTFNGMRLPSIALMDAMGAIRLVKAFGYDDFRGRLS
jgi:carboxynorspermidine decarboxylase